MARRTTRRSGTSGQAGTGPAGRGDGTLDPSEILAGWGEAIRLAAGAFCGPALRLAGQAVPKRRRGELAGAVRGFPVVGLAIGLIGALVYAVADGLGLSPLLSAVLAVAAMAFLDGAAHEAGLARMAEALLSGANKTERLRLMGERGHGTYGLVVLVVGFALRAGALAAIGNAGAVAAALVAAGAASYGAMAAVLHYLKPARRSGFAYEAGTPQFGQAALAVGLGAAVALLFLGPLTGLVALAVGAAGAFKFYWLARARLGGVTGGSLGAAQQGAEIGVLLAVAALR